MPRGISELLEEQGKTVVLVAADDKLAGFVAVADTARSDAAAAVRRLVERFQQPIPPDGHGGPAVAPTAAEQAAIGWASLGNAP